MLWIIWILDGQMNLFSEILSSETDSPWARTAPQGLKAHFIPPPTSRPLRLRSSTASSTVAFTRITRPFPFSPLPTHTPEPSHLAAPTFARSSSALSPETSIRQVCQPLPFPSLPAVRNRAPQTLMQAIYIRIWPKAAGFSYEQRTQGMFDWL